MFCKMEDFEKKIKENFFRPYAKESVSLTTSFAVGYHELHVFFFKIRNPSLID